MVRPGLQVLPAASTEAETNFVNAWMDSDDVEGLSETISLAMEARRPLLAARLVGLLEGRVEIVAGSALDRARRAAALYLVQRESGAEQAEPEAQELDLAWQAARRTRMMRIMRRMRTRPDLGPFGLGGRRRR